MIRLALILVVALSLSCASASTKPAAIVVTVPRPNTILVRAADRATVVCFERSPSRNYLHLGSQCFTVTELRDLIAVRYVVERETQ